uniref:Uncharacterized protein n=1 Tax=Moumouvirus sp. 'Monve' TaxID=1128131 RepID=H2EG31_9VIRU|nr:hypothetical protein mv_L1152 [Moumouvirus Monve]
MSEIQLPNIPIEVNYQYPNYEKLKQDYLDLEKKYEKLKQDYLDLKKKSDIFMPKTSNWDKYTISKLMETRSMMRNLLEEKKIEMNKNFEEEKKD